MEISGDGNEGNIKTGDYKDVFGRIMENMKNKVDGAFSDFKILADVVQDYGGPESRQKWREARDRMAAEAERSIEEKVTDKFQYEDEAEKFLRERGIEPPGSGSGRGRGGEKPKK